MTTGIITKLRNIHLSVHPPTPLTLSLRIRNQAGFTARTRYSTLHGTVHSDYPNLRTRTHPQAKPSGDKSERSTGVKAHLLQGKQNTSKTTLLFRDKESFHTSSLRSLELVSRVKVPRFSISYVPLSLSL
jgi:hypothetical protein